MFGGGEKKLGRCCPFNFFIFVVQKKDFARRGRGREGEEGRERGRTNERPRTDHVT